MSNVYAITPLVWTSEDNNAGTDSSVYMGIGGREFRLDTQRDDWERGNASNTSVGRFSQVNNAADNDPRHPLMIRTETLDLFPVYLRLEGDDHWKPWNALIWVYSGPDEDHLEVTDWFVADIDSSIENGVLKGGLWLGPNSGRWLYLRRGNRVDVQRILKANTKLQKQAEDKLANFGVKLF